MNTKPDDGPPLTHLLKQQNTAHGPSHLTQKPRDREARIATRRLERLRQAQWERRKCLSLWVGGSIVALAIILLIIHVASPAAKMSNGTIPGVLTYSNLSRDHTNGKVAYTTNPPVGGAHSPVWQNCGIYDQPVMNENAVHSLEHGAVWVTYLPTVSPSTIARLRTFLQGHSQIVLSPYPNQPAPIVLTAWGAQLAITSPTDTRLMQFLQQYENSPSAPEPRGECTGGVGAPINA